MKKRWFALGFCFALAFSATLFAWQNRFPPAITSATMHEVSSSVNHRSLANRFADTIGEPRPVIANLGGGGHARGYEWQWEQSGKLFISDWDFPHDETIPAFSFSASNRSTGPNANVLQIVDRGGSYNELAIDLLTELCDANGWEYKVQWAPRRKERMETNRRRALMRTQYFATQDVIDQLKSRSWYQRVDPDWYTLQLVPGEGDSTRPDAWGYEVTRDVFQRRETGERIGESTTRGYHIRVEGGLGHDGLSRLRVLAFPSKFNEHLIKELVEKYESEEWEYEVLYVQGGRASTDGS